jgi:uncharacterized protein YcfL
VAAIDATLYGTAAWGGSTQDGSASCLELDGASWATTAHDTKLDFTNSFCVMLRFKRNGTQSNAYVLSKLNTSVFNAWDVAYGFVTDSVEFHTNDYTGTDPRTGSQISITDDDWHGIAYKYDGTKWSYWLDGVETVINASVTFSLGTSSYSGLIFGSFDESSYYFTGLIDDVVLYNGTLPSDADITDWTASPFTLPSATPRGRWQFNETTGTTAADTGSDPSPPSDPIVSLTRSTASIAEAGGTVSIIATMDSTASATVTIAVGFSGDAATGSDYTLSTTSIEIASGQTSGSLTATAINDSVYEGDEAFTASIVSVTGSGASASSTASTSVVTIVDDEVAPVVNLSASTTSISEAAATAYVVARLANASYQNVTVNFGFSGSATLNTDYSRTTNSIVIASGSTSGSISITAIQDSLDEDNESILVGITSVTNGSAGATSSLSVTITDDDATPTVTLSASATTISENAGTAYFLATLSAPSGRTASFTVNLGTGTATNNTDFSASTTSFFWPAGTTTASIGVTSINDAASESNETIVMLLSSPTNCSSGSPFSASITIVDDDTSSPQTVSPGVANCICAALVPSLTIGGVTVSAGVATCATTANAPSLSGDTSLSVDPCTCSTSAIAPAVTPGAVSASPGTCSVIATVVAPTVVCGAVSVSPGVASASCSVVAPALSLVIVVTPGFASASCSATAPSITCGAVSVQPGTAICAVIVIGPPLEGEEPTGYASAMSGMSGIQVDGD